MLGTGDATVLDVRARDLLLTAATAAPSVHNSQPWQFAVDARRIDLFATPERHLEVSDTSGRSLLISCGAALFNLRVAADHLGLRSRVRLLPTLADATHVASVDLDRAPRPGPLAHLYPSVAVRRTNRYPFFSRRIPHSDLSRLAEAVSLENAVLRIYDEPAEVERIVGLLRDAESEEMMAPERLAERAAWVGGQRGVDGIPAGSLGPRPKDPQTPFRDLGAGPAHTDRPLAPFERTPTVAVLSTLGDGPVDWVRAGQALERVLLVATEAGLSASFMNQPLEHTDLRWLVRSPMTGHGHPQMIMRLGYGVPVPATPRRPLADVLRPAVLSPGR